MSDHANREWTSWDPMIASVRAHLSEDQRMAAIAMVGNRRVRLLLSRLRIRLWRLRKQWIDVAFTGLTSALLIGAILIAAVSWPLSTEKGSDFAGVVAACATATAFSGALFTAISLPLSQAGAIAAGYTADLLRRPLPWACAVAVLVMTAALFALATRRPDQNAAVAAGLAAAGSFGLVWISARSLLGSADPQELASRQATFMRRGAAEGTRQLRNGMKTILGRRASADAVRAMSLPDEQQMMAGFLRQERAGVRSSVASERDTEAIIFFDGMVSTFLDFAAFSKGQIGPADGPLGVLLGTIDELVTPDLRGRRDEIAAYAVRSLEKLAAVDYHEYDYRAVRSLLVDRLARYIETTWDNDITTVPASAAHTVGKCAGHFGRYGAYDDVSHTLERLASIGTTALAGHKVHIALPAYEVFVGVLPDLIRHDDQGIRRHGLGKWSECALELVATGILQPPAFQRPIDTLLPGMSLWSRGLQTVLWDCSDAPRDRLHDLIDMHLEWLPRVAEICRAVPYQAIAHPIHGFLSLLCCVALLASSDGQFSSDYAQQCAPRVAACAVGWLEDLDDERRRTFILDDDCAEMLWSCLLGASFIARDGELMAATSAQVLALLDLEHHDEPVRDEYTRLVVSGLLSATGVDGDDRDYLMGLIEPEDLWDNWSGDLHIDAFDHAPSMNRNRTVNIPTQVSAINAWALATFPSFATTEPSE